MHTQRLVVTHALRILVSLFLTAAGGAVSVPPVQDIQLTASMRSPTDVDLEWKDPGEAPGHVVEFTMNLADHFIPLGFFPPTETTMSHPRLVPRTTFYYRVRAFYGPVSKVVEISLPEKLSDSDYATRFAQPENYDWAHPQTLAAGVSPTLASVQTAPADSAPTELKAALVPITVSGIQLTWVDRAADADGYMLEIRPEGEREFVVCALMAPHVNAFGWALRPPMRKAVLRVRAFYYGKPSNLVQKTTGDDPDQALRVPHVRTKPAQP
jgi:hypothetical protein